MRFSSVLYHMWRGARPDALGLRACIAPGQPRVQWPPGRGLRQARNTALLTVGCFLGPATDNGVGRPARSWNELYRFLGVLIRLSKLNFYCRFRSESIELGN